MLPNTEHPITIHQGTNRLCHSENLEARVDSILSEQKGKASIPKLWDGHTATSLVESLKSVLFGEL